MEKNQLILSVKDLNIKFNLRGKVLHAIRGIDLDIYHGEVLAIVGESGSGKSVTAYSIMQILADNGRITSGEILSKGEDISRWGESKMQDFRGDNRELLDVAPDTIVIPNDYKLKRDVFAAIGADKDPSTANNGFNYNYGRWTVVIWPYLNQYITTGTAPWILLDKRYNDEYGSAMWLDRVKLEVRSELSSNDANVWKGYARFIAGFNDWRGFAVGGVTGGTQLIGA